MLLVGIAGRCSKIAEAEAAVSVNEKKWLVMHMHVQLKLDFRALLAVTAHLGAVSKLQLFVVV
jgi:hypothetical protein